MNMLRIIGADIDTTVQSYIQRPAKALSDKLVGFFEYVSKQAGGRQRGCAWRCVLQSGMRVNGGESSLRGENEMRQCID